MSLHGVRVSAYAPPPALQTDSFGKGPCENGDCRALEAPIASFARGRGVGPGWKTKCRSW